MPVKKSTKKGKGTPIKIIEESRREGFQPSGPYEYARRYRHPPGKPLAEMPRIRPLRGVRWYRALRKAEKTDSAKRRYVTGRRKKIAINMLSQERGSLKEAAEDLRKGAIYEDIVEKLRKRPEQRFNEILEEAGKTAEADWENVRDQKTWKEAKRIFEHERGNEIITKYGLTLEDYGLLLDYKQLLHTNPRFAAKSVRIAKETGLKDAVGVANVLTYGPAEKEVKKICREAAKTGEDPWRLWLKKQDEKGVKRTIRKNNGKRR